eukprot:GHVU01074678.1.p1 GENE.GHVU01074678.1~~GHVU01074678.1.p1  ORF type:complete len:150 (+),score=43.63 GHVU01074678.1:189-638(+)
MGDRPHQDWDVVTFNKSNDRYKGLKSDQKINEAERRGDAVEVQRKYHGGQNKAHAAGDTRKFEDDTGDYHVERVSLSFAKALQQARQEKNLTQAQLAQKINEKPTVINEYEGGKAVPNQQIAQKLNKALGTRLPPVTEKKKKPADAPEA